MKPVHAYILDTHVYLDMQRIYNCKHTPLHVKLYNTVKYTSDAVVSMMDTCYMYLQVRSEDATEDAIIDKMCEVFGFVRANNGSVIRLSDSK